MFSLSVSRLRAQEVRGRATPEGDQRRDRRLPTPQELRQQRCAGREGETGRKAKEEREGEEEGGR